MSEKSVFAGEPCFEQFGGKPWSAGVPKTYSAQRDGWHRLRSTRQEKLRDQGTR